ncbi:hypothetical protein Tco_0253068 [Tanacetum coccineum]
MFEDKSYEAHEDHKNLFAALQKSLERDYSNQLLADLEEARRKKRKKCATPRSPSRSSLSQQPPPPPLVGASGAPSYESVGISKAQELYPTDSLMHDDSIPDEQVHLSADEDSRNDHLPKADSRKDWWKPLPAKERPATPEPAWTILSSNMSDVENNWASALVSTYETPAENSLLAKTRDMTTFINWYCRQVDWTNPKGDQVRIDVNRPLPLGGPPSHDTIQTQFFFNKDLEYLRYGSKGSMPNMASPTGGLIHRSSILTDMILHRVEKKPESAHSARSSRSSSWFRQTDAIYCCQAMDPKLRWDAKAMEFKHVSILIMSLSIIVSPESSNSRSKRLDSGYEYVILYSKDVTMSKEFISAIERRLKTEKDRNLECFVGGRVCDIDYKLLQRTE